MTPASQFVGDSLRLAAFFLVTVVQRLKICCGFGRGGILGEAGDLKRFGSETLGMSRVPMVGLKWVLLEGCGVRL